MEIVWEFLPPALGLTALIWACALLLSITLSIPIAWMRRSPIKALRWFSLAWSTAAKGIPPIMWLVLIYFGLAVGVVAEFPWIAAVVGLAIVTSAFLADGIRAGLNSVEPGQWEAIRSTGIPRSTGLVRVISPQAFPIMLASSVTYSITLLKNTSIASIIGANELLFFMTGEVQSGVDALSTYLITGLIYLGFTIPLGILARWLQERSVVGRQARA